MSNLKELYSWYFPPTEREIESIWGSGVLTLDTNVLLDLYRYHADTRGAILKSLSQFEGRIWLSHQVSEEFFRNRNKVILSSDSAFSEAEKSVIEMRSASDEKVNSLFKNRILPDEIAEKLKKSLEGAFSEALEKISEVRKDYPNYRDNDPILDKISELVAEHIGNEYSPEELSTVHKEAKRRKDALIPPGYKDAGKDGNRPYGDYTMWRQILDHVKASGKPMIFVTSEQKEDWWEKISGKTVGPHHELLREVFNETNQKILFYRTDRFLEFASKQVGEEASLEVVTEVRELAKRRATRLPLLATSEQEVEMATQESQSGILTIQLAREAYKFTCSGHFEPEMISVPHLKIRLLEAPEGIPRHAVWGGTGTPFDFNIHVKSTEFGILLPTGKYVFTYSASSDSVEIVGGGEV